MPEPLENTLSQAIARLIPKPARVVVAVSGGPDSVALLRSWHRLARGDQLVVAHFDHQWRPDSADDARFVEQLAGELHLPLELGTPSADTKANEESARNARYAFLQDVADRFEASFVATAHHQEDQVETILHAILRGTGLRGLRGIPEQRPLGPRVTLVRPLLHVSRDEIESYLQRVGQAYRTDPSNVSDAFARNRIRQTLLPLLREDFNPNVDAALLRLGELASWGTELITLKVTELRRAAVAEESPTEIWLKQRVLAEANDRELGELFRELLREKHWPLGRIGRTETERFAEVVYGVAPAWDLPDGIRVYSRPRKDPRVVIARLGANSAATAADGEGFSADEL